MPSLKDQLEKTLTQLLDVKLTLLNNMNNTSLYEDNNIKIFEEYFSHLKDIMQVIEIIQKCI